MYYYSPAVRTALCVTLVLIYPIIRFRFGTTMNLLCFGNEILMTKKGAEAIPDRIAFVCSRKRTNWYSFWGFGFGIMAFVLSVADI